MRAVAYGGGGTFVQSIVGLDLVAGERILHIGDLDTEGMAIFQRAAVTAERFDMPPPDSRWFRCVVGSREGSSPGAVGTGSNGGEEIIERCREPALGCVVSRPRS